MALIKCPECGHEISHIAAACPFCGCPAALWTDETNPCLFMANNKPRIVIERGHLTFFGRYPFDEDGTVKSIPWYVWTLDPRKKLALLICDRIIDAKPYNKSDTLSRKENSLYYWLNHTFAKESFSAAEYAKLQNPLANETEDSLPQIVFLPTEEDVDNIFGDKNESRKCRVTPYAKTRGVWVDEETGCGIWWINKPFGTYCTAITPDGTLDRNRGIAVDYENVGVRPIIVLSYTPADTMVDAPAGSVGYIELT